MTSFTEEEMKVLYAMLQWDFGGDDAFYDIAQDQDWSEEKQREFLCKFGVEYQE